MSKKSDAIITEDRLKKMEKVLSNRTKFLTIALEDIFQPQNASAVLRTCECFGIQDIHIIENKNKYEINPDVVLGSNKWLSIFRYNQKNNNTIDCIKKLKKDGYKILASTITNESIPLQNYELKNKTAIFFGTEMTGLSSEALEHSDEQIIIPMKGFTQSFNLSVSAAIILYQLRNNLEESNLDWKLTYEHIDRIKNEWILNRINQK